jgi:hypothetical protein
MLFMQTRLEELRLGELMEMGLALVTPGVGGLNSGHVRARRGGRGRGRGHGRGRGSGSALAPSRTRTRQVRPAPRLDM